ncbi:MAG: hypothetical protein R3Y13_04020 [bacterium]
MNNREIIKLCENFYEIINFEPLIEDAITPKMINLYREYIFTPREATAENINNIVNLDKAMKRYIADYLFRKDLQNCIKNLKIKTEEVKDALKIFIDKVIDFFMNYHVYTTRVIYISCWI